MELLVFGNDTNLSNERLIYMCCRGVLVLLQPSQEGGMCGGTEVCIDAIGVSLITHTNLNNDLSVITEARLQIGWLEA
jgi:hypothetical protein